MCEAGRIRKLDETVVNRIAAGEVIQRPANALKELIENSIDAKAANIQITIRNGGMKLLQIQDDGTGIRKDDFEIVCERFTTSKLREFEDLTSISTYGFRGEALASISHIAYLSIVSKTADQICAYKASYVDGKLKDGIKATAGNQGTQITVEDLFFNMAARQTALRNNADEFQRIADIVGKYSIHNASIGFALRKQMENNTIRTPPNSTQIDNIGIIFGNSISKELEEFSVENSAYQFKAKGYFTNPNFNSKKSNFLLFINNRLVDCQSLRKNIEGIYSQYMPKHRYPFVYLSLEIKPQNVDVNVHPTKHEVHFLHESEISEAIVKALENKLVNSSKSRTFYVQAKLPVFNEPTVRDHATTSKSIYPKEFVRTRSNVQKLDKFFGAPTNLRNTKEKTNDDEYPQLNNSDVEFKEQSEKFVAKTTEYEHLILDKTVSSKEESPKILNEVREVVSSESKKEQTNSNKTVPEKRTHSPQKSRQKHKRIRVETNLASVQQLRDEIESACSWPMRDFFAQHVFVGCVSPTQALIQHSTKLHLCYTERILEELLYSFVIFNFQNFDIFSFTDELNIASLAHMAIKQPVTGWTEEDGDQTELARKVAEILIQKGSMLQDYFSIEIDVEKGTIKGLPVLIENYVPDMSRLSMYVLRLATDVNWEDEKECFRTFARETAQFYSHIAFHVDNWKWTVEHVIYPAIKEYFMPNNEFACSGAVLQLTDLQTLYKVFERC